MQFEQAGSGHAAAPAYPRRRVLRMVLRMLAGLAFAILGRVRIEGKENLPQGGPYIMVANHFPFFRSRRLAVGLSPADRVHRRFPFHHGAKDRAFPAAFMGIFPGISRRIFTADSALCNDCPAAGRHRWLVS